MCPDKESLDNRVTQAHKEKNISLLVELYAKASKSTSDHNLSCFLATQAYVLALECNHPLSQNLHSYLKLNNRED